MKYSNMEQSETTGSKTKQRGYNGSIASLTPPPDKNRQGNGKQGGRPRRRVEIRRRGVGDFTGVDEKTEKRRRVEVMEGREVAMALSKRWRGEMKAGEWRRSPLYVWMTRSPAGRTDASMHRRETAPLRSPPHRGTHPRSSPSLSRRNAASREAVSPF